MRILGVLLGAAALGALPVRAAPATGLTPASEGPTTAAQAGAAASAAGPRAAATCQAGVGAGPLRRLTRFEYENTVRDLLGQAGQTSRSFPEEGGSGFDNNADLAVATRIHAQKYMRAAEELAAQATADLPRLLGCDPAARDGAAEAACVRGWLDRFAPRAWRRPLAADERASLRAFYDGARADHDRATAVRLVLQALLESPHFLYRVEAGRPVPGRPGVLQLDDHELASRLSYFLWGTMPDEPLFRAARAGRLHTPAQLAAHARRMLKDPRARVTVRRFHDQWLGLGLLDRLQKEQPKAPRWVNKQSPALLRGQFDRLVDHVMWEADGRLATLLTTPVTFLDRDLATLLDEPAPDAEGWVRTTTGGERRAGLLTSAAFLAMQANVNETSPIKRGMFVREQLLCQIPPPPPPNVEINGLPPASKDLPTLRDRLEDHRADLGCNKCHRLFDPLGLAFETYDLVGAYRSTEAGRPVDASGELVETDVDGEFQDVVGLARKLAGSRQVAGCVVKQWFRFAFGRTESEKDACTLDRLTDAFVHGGGRIPELLVDLVRSDAFRHRAPAAPLTASRGDSP